MKLIKLMKLNIFYVLILAILTVLVIYFNYQLNITEAKLKVAEKPSKIEVQKETLSNLEKDWVRLNESILELRNKADNQEKEKLELEPTIRTLRNEILGVKK